MDLNKYIVTGDVGTPLHSSGYAQAANAGHVGSVSPVSFNARQTAEQTRQVVGGYDRSIVGQSYGSMRAKTVQSGGESRTSMRPRTTLGQNNTTPSPPRGFSEPSSRSYNPYA